MPVIYEYLGVIFKFFSKEHEPIHIHAVYQGATLKIEFFIRNGKVYKVVFKQEKGIFPPAKIKDVEKFIQLYKEEIIRRWDEYFIWNKKVKKQTITKRLK